MRSQLLTRPARVRQKATIYTVHHVAYILHIYILRDPDSWDQSGSVSNTDCQISQIQGRK